MTTESCAATSAAQPSTSFSMAPARSAATTMRPFRPYLNGSGNVAVSRLGQGGALGNVALADVVGQDVDGGAVAGDQRLEATTAADGAQLAVVADHHDPGARCCSMVQQLHQVLVAGHGRLVEDDHRAVVKCQLTMLQAPRE